MSSSNVVDTLNAAGDTLHAAGKNDSGWIMHHITDSRVLDFQPFGEISYSPVSFTYLE
jgi:hypothetical protein